MSSEAAVRQMDALAEATHMPGQPPLPDPAELVAETIVRVARRSLHTLSTLGFVEADDARRFYLRPRVLSSSCRDDS